MSTTRMAANRMAATRMAATIVAAVLVFTACGGDDDDDAGGGATTTTRAEATTTTSAPETSTTATTGPSDGGAVTVAIASTTVGDALVDERGLTLYVFDNDGTDSSSCTEGCASAWPPLVVTGTPTVGDGLDAANFTTFARADGAQQVAVNGHPLYTFASDGGPGDVTGQGVGGVWWVAGANGEKITEG